MQVRSELLSTPSDDLLAWESWVGLEVTGKGG